MGDMADRAARDAATDRIAIENGCLRAELATLRAERDALRQLVRDALMHLPHVACYSQPCGRGCLMERARRALAGEGNDV